MSHKSKGQTPSPYGEVQRHSALQVESCLVTRQPHPAPLTHMQWSYQRDFFGKFYLESLVDLQFMSETRLF